MQQLNEACVSALFTAAERWLKFQQNQPPSSHPQPLSSPCRPSPLCSPLLSFSAAPPHPNPFCIFLPSIHYLMDEKIMISLPLSLSVRLHVKGHDFFLGIHVHGVNDFFFFFIFFFLYDRLRIWFGNFISWDYPLIERKKDRPNWCLFRFVLFFIDLKKSSCTNLTCIYSLIFFPNFNFSLLISLLVISSKVITDPDLNQLISSIWEKNQNAIKKSTKASTGGPSCVPGLQEASPWTMVEATDMTEQTAQIESCTTWLWWN